MTSERNPRRDNARTLLSTDWIENGKRGAAGVKMMVAPTPDASRVLGGIELVAQAAVATLLADEREAAHPEAGDEDHQ